jgi:putative flippase GtrA
LIVGVANTLLGTTLMFLFYNLTGFGYWGSSTIAFTLASIFSYFANKRFTFSYVGKGLDSFIRFTIVIAVSYFIGFFISKNFVIIITEKFFVAISLKNTEQIALLFGSVIFTLLNYFGQRYFAFSKKSR